MFFPLRSHVSKDVTTSSKTTSPNFTNSGKENVSTEKGAKEGRYTSESENDHDSINETEKKRKDRQLRKFVDYVLRGVKSGVLPNVSTSRDKKPTDGSNMKDDCVTKERRSKKKEDICVNLDDLESDEEPIARILAPSVARRLRKRKEINVMTNDSPYVKTTGRRSAPSKISKGKASVGPSKKWSKVVVQTKKRNNVSSNESDYDVKKDVQDISPKRKLVAKRRSIAAIAKSPLDTMSFIQQKML